MHESASASLVEVPVHVIGRDGKPVRGLTASDFEVEDDGKKQAITAVDVIDLNQTREVTGLSSDLPAASRRHFLFLFDLTYATSSEIIRAREAASRFIVDGLDPDDLAAVATTSVEQGARLQMTFSADRRQLVRAISSVGLPSQSEERAYDPLAFVFSMPGDPTSNSSVQEQTKGTSSIIDPTSATRLYAAMAQKDADDYAVTRVGRHLGSMGALAGALDAVEGRKTIVYFSEGFDGRLLFGSVANSKGGDSKTNSENDAMYSGQFWTFDVDRRYADGPLHRDLAETIGFFRRSDCVVYPIDISGLKAEGDTAVGASGRGEESLFALAHGTGGEVLKNANDLSAQLKRIADRTSLTYVLAFQAPQTGEEGHFHALRVRVKQKGVRVSARAGYYETRSFQSMTPLQRMLSAADVISHDKGEGSLPLEVLAISFGGEKISRVPVLLQIPGSAFAASPAGRLPLELYVYVTGEDGRVADFFTRAVSIDTAAASGERLRRSGVVFYGTCRLLPGHYRVRAYARDGRDGRFGFRVASLDVPETPAGGMRALPPLFLNDEDGLRLKDHAGTPAGESEPFRVGPVAFVPQVTPRLAAGGSSRVCLMVYRKVTSAAIAPFQIDAQVVGAGGHRRPARLSLIGRSEPDAEGLVKLLLEFSASDLPSGDYSLHVRFRDTNDEKSTSESEAPFRIS